MGDEEKQNSGTSDTHDKKDTLINELDSLRYTLNSGPEFQQGIPTLDEPYPVQSEQCDLFRGSDGLIHDPDLDIPILTDTLESTDTTTPLVEAGANTTSADSSFVANTEERSAQGDITDQNEEPATAPQTPPIAPSDIEQRLVETDSSVQELEQVLDELVAEQLPKLEQQLRDKLRKELKPK